jgi:hypothetical protein
MATGRKTGGRTKGTPNRATAAKAAAIAASGLTPLDYMLTIMRDEAAPAERRIEAAKAAAPYVHPKLAAIEHAGHDGGPVQIIVDTGIRRDGDDCGLSR